MKTAYLALGSNLGDRENNLARAAEELASADLRVVRSSSVYETEPKYVRDQPWFLNQVIEIETSLFPRQLLAHAKKVERRLGRQFTTPNGPRAIDIDVLLFAQVVMHSAELQIPHPRLPERRFVLEPLAELVPQMRHPATARTVSEMLAEVKEQSVRKLAR